MMKDLVGYDAYFRYIVGIARLSGMSPILIDGWIKDEAKQSEESIVRVAERRYAEALALGEGFSDGGEDDFFKGGPVA